jgi:hypothetical protein
MEQNRTARYDIEVIPVGGTNTVVPWLDIDEVFGAVRSLGNGECAVITRTDKDADPGTEY